MEIRTWTIRQEELDKLLNDAKNCVLERLVLENIITKDQANLGYSFAVTVANKKDSRFGAWLNKLLWKPASTENIFVVSKVFYFPESPKSEEVVNVSQAN